MARKIVIIGNSAAGLNALDTFRKYDKESSVDILSKESGLPYSRVLLPYYLRNKTTHEKLFIRTDGYYEKLSANYLQDTVAVVNEEGKYLKLTSGKTLEYDRLLVAAGSSPIKPSIRGLEAPGVYHMWTIDDIKKIEPYFTRGARVLILGSGFVSMQAAWAALQRGLSVSLYELCPRVMPRVLDAKGSKILQNRMIQEKINLKLGVVTERIQQSANNTLLVFAENEKPLEVDLIIVGTGVRPNIDFIQGSTIKIDKGILVNNYMETSSPSIYAAGDVAQGPVILSEKKEVHALWPTAVEQGKIAGANMAGQNISYKGSLNMNITELFGVTVASMGCFENYGCNCSAIEYYDEETSTYLKVVLENDVPIGSVSVGCASKASFLGVLRPLIKQRRKVYSIDNIIKELHVKIGGGKVVCE